MPKSVSKTRSIFAFLGATEFESDADINVLQERLGKRLLRYNESAKIKREGDLLILPLRNPDFCFYVALVKNSSGELSDWVNMAKNFRLKWDKKPVTEARLKFIIDSLGNAGKSEYNAHQKIGFGILHELENFTQMKVFTIPSFEKKKAWYKIFN